jgi:hypothetical protein
MESAAATVLTRAVEMDTKEQYTMALLLYQEGVQILLNTVKGTTILKFACISSYFYGLFYLCNSLFVNSSVAKDDYVYVLLLSL